MVWGVEAGSIEPTSNDDQATYKSEGLDRGNTPRPARPF
jgi:hypothetical protein